jgi:hypothetical protein
MSFSLPGGTGEMILADTIFGSNFLCKCVTRRRQVSPFLYEFAYHRGSTVTTAQRDIRFWKKRATSGYTYVVTGTVLNKSGGQLIKGGPTGGLLGGEITARNSEKLVLCTMLQSATDLSVFVKRVMTVRLHKGPNCLST